MAQIKIGVLTSGGDAPGMNAAVRAVVRTAIAKKATPYAIYEGYRGMVEGGERIKPIEWSDVGGILHRGGTIIGTARCQRFLTQAGRVEAAFNLVINGINNLVVIGGDGSLTGALTLHEEWDDLLDILVANGRLTPPQANQNRHLTIIGLVGSIDNDVYGTDITIGADTALHRITYAIDAISSTAASHQRSFVVEVMGRKCGYLALMSALATGADWALIPENPPNLDDWEEKMCSVLKKGRDIGRRDSIVIVAEGAQDRHGNPIKSNYVKEILEEKLGEDTRVTILGHVQRGGAPTPFDRNLSSMLGSAAVEKILTPGFETQPILIGMQGNKITYTPLKFCLEKTKEISAAIKRKDFTEAMLLRGESFSTYFKILRTLVRAIPHGPTPGKRRLRLAVMNAGAPAPGMNTAVRAAVRLGVDAGHFMLGIAHGFHGLIKGDIFELDWMSVNGWARFGGSQIGTKRFVPTGTDFYEIARNIEKHQLDGLLVIGGASAYQSALSLYERRKTFHAFNIPIVALPATIDNDLPGSELSVGSDTALNSIVDALDKIKQSAVASKRVFIVEVMGKHCGYLALMSALASGAERVYLHEEGITLQELEKDISQLISDFKGGKRLGLIIRNEFANPIYTTPFIRDLFAAEGAPHFDVRQAILGHLQQGGDPTPFDRIMANRFAHECIQFLETQILAGSNRSGAVGILSGKVTLTDFEFIPQMLEQIHGRPEDQWWLQFRPLAYLLSKQE